MRMNLCYALMALLGLAPFMGVNAQYDLTIEQSTPAAAPGTVYRFYVEANDASDKISAVFGNDQMPLVISTPDGIFNSALNSAWNASGINSALFGFFQTCKTTALRPSDWTVLPWFLAPRIHLWCKTPRSPRR